MKRWLAAWAALALLCPWSASAHLGSPDVFFDGVAGAYPVSVTIRMPSVVPGRAQILVRVGNSDSVSVAIAPIAAKTAVSNTPPAEAAQAVAGETNLFAGELWLMTGGAYGIDVRVRGPSGEGAVQVPVNSVATKLLPLPSWLGGALLALGAVLFCAGVAIVAAAAGESILPPGAEWGSAQRRRYWKGVVITSIVFALLLIGGKRWWNAEEANFQARLHEGGWPDLAAKIHARGSQRVLDLKLGNEDWDQKKFELEPDHGKMLHLYLTRLPNHDAFAHLHPVRAGAYNRYEVALPPLPEGDYEVLCDLTLAQTGFSSTATNVVHIPAVADKPAPANPLKADPDDSWALDSAVAARDKAGGDAICQLPGGAQVIWKAHPALRARQDAGLRFELRDASGKPAALEPYMGMMSHAAVLRSDGKVFAHLHPSGNYSMASQVFFDNKLGKEGTVGLPGHGPVCGAAGTAGAAGRALISLPYEFPTAGDYRLWVQVKSGGRVETAIFDTTVLAGSP